MSFDIKLQINNSEPNRVKKDITDVITVSGTMRAGSSVMSLSVTVQGDISTITGINYMTIPAFERSYFVTDIVVDSNNLLQIHGKVDVLSTYSEQILNNSAIIQRQESKWNLYLDDGVFQTYQNPDIVTKPFPSGFNTMEFVLAVAGA